MLGTCEATGDIDAVSGPAFGALLRNAIDAADTVLLSVDCSGVTFMDPAGYHVLVASTQYAARRGRTLVIRNASPPCARLLRLYGWDRELCVDPSSRHLERVY